MTQSRRQLGYDGGSFSFECNGDEGGIALGMLGHGGNYVVGEDEM